MNFIEKILATFKNLMSFLSGIFTGLIDFLTKPLAYLLSFLEGIFYFIAQLFIVAIEIIQLFVALFQYFFSIARNLIETLSNFIGFSSASDYNLPGASRLGFEVALEQIGGTGLLTVVPNILIGIMWIYFALRMIKLFGNKGETPKK